MLQKLADHLDQMDLALDQLNAGDRNLDRFAMMLIDNVIELVLHTFALDKAQEAKIWGPHGTRKYPTKAIADALGKRFDAKVQLARKERLMDANVADSVNYLHEFRNTAHHSGLRHDGILHSLAIFYFRNACAILARYQPAIWVMGGQDKVSQRARKYLGTLNVANPERAFELAWVRLGEVVDSLEDSLTDALSKDMSNTLQRVDESLNFLVAEAMEATSRDQVMLDLQAWHMAFSDEGKAWARAHGGPVAPAIDAVNWLMANYKFKIRTDPLPSWRRRLTALQREKDPHAALKKYCDFLASTEAIRSQIEEASSQLGAHIDSQVDAFIEEQAFHKRLAAGR